MTPVGTHGLCVRCVKGYRIRPLTGTDAIRLDTSRASLQIVTRSDPFRYTPISNS